MYCLGLVPWMERLNQAAYLDAFRKIRLMPAPEFFSPFLTSHSSLIPYTTIQGLYVCTHPWHFILPTGSRTLRPAEVVEKLKIGVNTI